MLTQSNHSTHDGGRVQRCSTLVRLWDVQKRDWWWWGGWGACQRAFHRHSLPTRPATGRWRTQLQSRPVHAQVLPFGQSNPVLHSPDGPDWGDFDRGEGVERLSLLQNCASGMCWLFHYRKSSALSIQNPGYMKDDFFVEIDSLYVQNNLHLENVSAPV